MQKIKLVLAFALICVLAVPVMAGSAAAGTSSSHEAIWTTKGDFENNAATTGTPASRSLVGISGVNPADDAHVSLLSAPTHSVAAGSSHTVGLKGDGTVAAIGNNLHGQTDTSSWSDITSVAAGRYHTVGLKRDGTVEAVGNSSFEQADTSSWSGIVAVAAGNLHTVGLKGDGTVVAIGNDDYGQADTSSWSGIVAVAAGSLHTVGLKSDGTVEAIGNNDYGQADTSSWSGIVAVTAGSLHTVGLKSDGTVVVAGNNDYNQLDTSSWSGIVAVAAGAYHTVGLKNDGTVVGVGNNGYGQINTSSWSGITDLAAGAYHTVGLKNDGNVVAQGNNTFFQINTSFWSGMKAPGKNYFSPGVISSLKLSGGNAAVMWDKISWHGTAPNGTAIKFRTRSADSEEGLASAAWSQYYSTSGASIDQYQSPNPWLEVELSLHSDAQSTPVLDDFTVSYMTDDPLPVSLPESLEGVVNQVLGLLNL